MSHAAAFPSLPRFVRIRGNDVVPPRMTGLTQKRLRPPVGFLSEQMKWRPVVSLGAVRTTHLALVSRPARFDFARNDTGRLNCCLGYEVRRSIPAVAHEEVLDGTPLIPALHNLPRLVPLALWAWIVRPRKGSF